MVGRQAMVARMKVAFADWSQICSIFDFPSTLIYFRNNSEHSIPNPRSSDSGQQSVSLHAKIGNEDDGEKK